MAKELVVRIKTAWWFRWIYLPGLFALVHVVSFFNPNVEINQRRLRYWLEKAVTMEVP